MKELILFIESIEDRKVIESMILNFDITLIDFLRYTNEETETRWLEIYNDILGGMKNAQI